MDNFSLFVPTKIHFGENQVEKKLAEALNEFKAKKVMMTYGGGSIKKSGLYDQVIKILKENKFELHEYGGIKPNPTLKSVEQGIKEFKDNKCDFILSVGGGSVLDATKAIARGIFSDVPIWQHFERNVTSLFKDTSVKPVEVTKAAPIGCILTLAATGSEYNSGCVVTNEETKQKFFCKSDLCRPKFSILDPKLTYTVSPYQTKAGGNVIFYTDFSIGFDIISHAFEQYMSENCPYLVDYFALSIINTVVKWLPIAIKEPKNYEARSNILFASSLALCGIVFSGRKNAGFMVHKLEHEVSALYPSFTHGIGLSILTIGYLRKVLKKEKTAEKLVKFGEMVFGMKFETNSIENGAKVIDKLENWLEKNEIPTKLTQVIKDFDEKAAQKCADMFVESWGDPVKIGWEKLTKEDVFEIYKMRI